MSTKRRYLCLIVHFIINKFWFLETKSKLQICNNFTKQRLSHDALYNLRELVYDLNGFVHKVITYPDLIVVCGNKTVLKECNRLLSLSYQQINDPQLMSYDTTFQLGDFYVSPLLFRNTLFKKSPIMPAMFLIHERKLSSTHKEMMMSVAKELPFVSDDEKGFFWSDWFTSSQCA